MSSEPKWLTADERSAWLATAAMITRLPAALDAQLQADAGLGLYEYLVMAILSEQPDRTMQMSDIARATSASLSRLSHTASRLERQGFLQRARCPGPGRRTLATLTDDGYAKVVASAPGHVAHVRHLLIDAVDPDDLAALRRSCEAVLERIDPTDTCG